VRGRLLALALAGSVVMSVASPVAAGQLDNDLASVRSKIADLKSELASAGNGRTTAVEELLAAQALLDAAELTVSATEAEFDVSEDAMRVSQIRLVDVRSELAIRFARLEVVRAEVARAREEAMGWAREAYMRGGMAEPAIAFSAPALADVSVGVAYLDVLTGASSEVADRFQENVDRQTVEEARVLRVEAAVELEVRAHATALKELARIRIVLEADRASLASQAAGQVARLASIEHEIAEFETEISALAREEAGIRSAIIAASTPSPSSSAPGELARPVPGRVSSGFGKRIHPISKTVKMHNGVDMNANQGDRIIASENGVVILSGVKGGYGNTVMIDHGGGMVTLYAHQSKLGVSVGQQVTRGQTIGWIGSTGQSTGPHLHFEVRINGRPVNPVGYW
jgi:murein DD-endopeptidase MepM/ murein hydrolase activator NlpD